MMTSHPTRRIAFSFVAGFGSLCLAMLTVPSAHAQMGMSNDGLEFPDGSVQTTAAVSQATYAIGDTGPAGGLVFHVTDDGLHGLEAAPADQSSAATWGCRNTDVVVPTADTSLGMGASNTNDIIRGCIEAGIAAVLAAEYVSPSGYYDWYLPSKDELNKMYTELHFNGMGGFARVFYWSSSETTDDFVWYQDFLDGDQDGFPKNITLLARAVRAF